MAIDGCRNQRSLSRSRGRERSRSRRGRDRNKRAAIRFVLIFTAGYALVQAIGGWYSGSLALIADSGHMVSDAAALLLALIAYRIARRPADAKRTYGFHRVRVLAALANGGRYYCWSPGSHGKRPSASISPLRS